MNKYRLTALLLIIATCVGIFAGCVEGTPDITTATGAGDIVTEPLPIDTEPASTDAQTEPATEPVDTDPVPGGPGYVIPDEELSGKNVKNDPAADDGDGAAILQRLIKESIIKNADAKADGLVPRIDFAYDIANCTGFMQQQSVYICENVYTDMEKHYTSAYKHISHKAIGHPMYLLPCGWLFHLTSGLHGCNQLELKMYTILETK